MAGFDIVVPNYNYGRYLGQCVRSALAQDVDPLRVLVVDNASTDESLEVAHDLARDPRVEIRVHPRNLGPQASFNAGVDWAKADYFLILCADDLLLPGALSRAETVLNGDPALAFCYGREIAIGAADGLPVLSEAPQVPAYRHVAGRTFIKNACRQGVMETATAALTIRTKYIKQAGHFRNLYFEDYEFWLRLASIGDVAQLDAAQAAVRYHGENMGHTQAPTHLDMIRHTSAAIESFFGHEGASLPAATHLRRIARRGLAERAFWGALAAWARGGEGGRGLMRYALRQRPWLLVAPPIGYLLHRDNATTRISSTLQALVSQS